MTKSVVSIVKGKDVEAMAKEALDLIGGIESVVKKGDVVLIKPNCHGPHPWEDHITTDPRLIVAVIKLCKKAGAKEIWVGEAPSLGGAMLSFEISGQKAAVEGTGMAKLIDLDNTEYVTMKVPNGMILKKVDRPKIVRDCNVLISMPIIKTHHGTKMTASLKNMMGTLSRAEKTMIHMVGLSESICDLNISRKPDLALADMIVSMEGMGPIAGRTVVEQPDGSRKMMKTVGGILVPLDMVVASKDPVACDATCARIVNFIPEEIDHIRYAYEHGLGNIKSSEIEVKGQKIKDVKHPFSHHPTDIHEFAEYLTVHDENACFGCKGYLYMTLSNVRARDLLKKRPDVHLVIGPKESIPDEWGTGDNLILVGNCLEKWKHLGQWAGGCVPNQWWQSIALLGKIGTQEERMACRKTMQDTLPKE